MSQLDSGTFQQVKDLVLSGYHLNDIHGSGLPDRPVTTKYKR